MSIQRLSGSPASAAKTAKPPRGNSARQQAPRFADALAKGKKNSRRELSTEQRLMAKAEQQRRDNPEAEPPTVPGDPSLQLAAGSVLEVAARVAPSEGAGTAAASGLAGSDQRILDQMVAQVISAARTLDGGRGQHLQISLNLGALGQAEVELRKDANGAIDLLFRAEDAAAEGELGRGLSELRRRLLSRGLRPGRLEVRRDSEQRR